MSVGAVGIGLVLGVFLLVKVLRRNPVAEVQTAATPAEVPPAPPAPPAAESAA